MMMMMLGGNVKERKLFLTFEMRARRYERTRNLKRSSSVWMMMRRKLALGSRSPVCSSTISICRFQNQSVLIECHNPNWNNEY